MNSISIGPVSVNRLCMSGSVFGGYSLQSEARVETMLDYFTPERIKETLRDAQDAGINTLFARSDDHMIGVLDEYWDEGGTIQWFAQVVGGQEEWDMWLETCLDLGPAGVCIDGSVVDKWIADKDYSHFGAVVQAGRGADVVVGFGGHRPDTHEWIRDNVDCDFQMCSYYNPIDYTEGRKVRPRKEAWSSRERDQMLQVIETIPRTVVHHKTLASSNVSFDAAFEVTCSALRPNDVLSMGMYPEDEGDLIRKNVERFDTYIDNQDGPVLDIDDILQSE